MDMAAKLKALREKKANESAGISTISAISPAINSPVTESTQSSSSPTPSTSVSLVISGNNPNSAPVQSEESVKTASSGDVSLLDIPVDSIGKGSGNNSIATVESNASVSFDDLEFLSKLDSLEQMLLTPHPSMPVILRDIHNRLKADPELVTTLTEDQIGVIVNGLKRQTNTELSGTIAKQSKAKDKKTVLSIDML